MKKILGILLFTCVANAFGLDMQDIGEYAVIHKDGHITNKVSRLSYEENQWKIEDQKDDGTWDDVTCEKNCKLTESSQKDIEYFMGGKAPNGMAAECVHNKAFAFCRITRQGSTKRKYILIALTQQRPIPINLHRIEQ